MWSTQTAWTICVNNGQLCLQTPPRVAHACHLDHIYQMKLAARILRQEHGHQTLASLPLHPANMSSVEHNANSYGYSIKQTGKLRDAVQDK